MDADRSRQVLRRPLTITAVLAFIAVGVIVFDGSWFRGAKPRLLFPRHLETLNGHDHSVICLDFSADSRKLGSSCLGGKAIVWEVATGKELFRRYHGDTNVTSIRFHPTDGTVFTACWDGRVRIWDLAKPEQMDPKTTYQEPIGGEGISSMVIDGTGTKILTCVGIDKGPIVWDLTAGTFKRYESDGWSTVVAFIPSGRQFIGGGYSQTVLVWNTENEQPVAQFATGDLVLCMCYSPDGKYIATGSREAVVQVWDAKTFKKIGVTGEHRDNIAGLQFTPDGKYLLSCCGYEAGNEEVRIWDVGAKRDLAMFAPHEKGCTALAISPNGKLLSTASCAGEIRVWDLSAILAEAKK